MLTLAELKRLPHGMSDSPSIIRSIASVMADPLQRSARVQQLGCAFPRKPRPKWWYIEWRNLPNHDMTLWVWSLPVPLSVVYAEIYKVINIVILQGLGMFENFLFMSSSLMTVKSVDLFFDGNISVNNSGAYHHSFPVVATCVCIYCKHTSTYITSCIHFLFARV